jgi:cellulose synthase/poly-beta-1,6-N-acetylglucosamine synthase-like glycosyltransferase
MLAYRYGWKHLKNFVLPAEFQPLTFISVIIPARNEKENIGACIESILAQKYPLGQLEIIVVDDHSEDGTAEIVNEYADYLEPGQKINSYKKAAISKGIGAAKGSLIITTDADCIAPNAWLMHIAAIHELEQSQMVIAPVNFITGHSILEMFQGIDFMSMQGITAAAYSLKLGKMCNGANLAFTKAAFEEVRGYEGIDTLASGDDYLLMMKISKLPDAKISYLKSPYAIISTKPQPDWGSFFQQRIRWASKSGKYNDFKLTAVLLLVYMFNLAFPVLLVGSFYNTDLFFVALLMLGIKILAEFFFLVPVARFYNEEWVLKYFPLLQPLHISYIVIAGFLGFWGKYSWKGRRVK